MNLLYPEDTQDLKLEQRLWKSGIQRVAGIDEAGRGALAGPVVAAAVIFSHRAKSLLGRVKDSKKIPEKKRELLFEEIHALADAVGVGIVEQEEIDRINILQASFSAMRIAAQNLSVPPDLCLVDGNQDPKIGYAQKLMIKGDDRVFSIGAASIIAKVTRDRIMRNLAKDFPAYGFLENKGYGTKKHLEALLDYGLSPVHRKTFRPKSMR